MKFLKTLESFINEAKKSALELEDHIRDLETELKDLKRELKSLFEEQDLEAGEKGEDWTDADANRYGAQMNEVEKKIESKQEEIKKAEAQLYNLTKSRGPREPKPGDDIRKILKKNLDDIEKSQKSWPDRTAEEQAKIYKKRYNIEYNVSKIVDIMKELKIVE